MAQFVLPSRKAVFTCDRAVQMLTSAPFYAIAKELVYRLKEIGFAFQFTSLASYSRAARIRLVARSGCIRSCWDRWDSWADHPDFMPAPYLSDWLERSITRNLRDNFDECEPIQGMMQAMVMPNLQARAYVVLHSNAMYETDLFRIGECLDAFNRRISYLIKDNPYVANVKLALDSFCKVNRALPDGIGTSVLKTICNGWATSGRFHYANNCKFGGSSVRSCYFCGRLRGDTVMHYLG